MSTLDKILNLTKQLYPNGRAFKVPPGSELEKFETAMGSSQAGAFDDAMAILDALLPDNDNFTAEDATRWEERLGMVVSEGVALADRKAAIQTKMNHPGDIQARQSADYLQQQLQAAGFDLYVFENTSLQHPSDLDPSGLADLELGTFELGEGQLGQFWEDVVVNNIDYLKDQLFPIPEQLRGTFFICGSTLGAYANVDENSRETLRQLLLNLKPCESIGFLFVNYTY